MKPIAKEWRHRGHTSTAVFFTYESRTRLAMATAILIALILALSDAAGQNLITGLQPVTGSPGTRINTLIDPADGFRPTLANKDDFCVIRTNHKSTEYHR